MKFHPCHLLAETEHVVSGTDCFLRRTECRSWMRESSDWACSTLPVHGDVCAVMFARSIIYVPAKSNFLRSTSLSAPSGRRHKYKAMKRKITILLPETKHRLANWNSKLLYIKVLATLTAASWHFMLRVFINKSAVCVRWKNFWNKQLWGMFSEGGGRL